MVKNGKQIKRNVVSLIGKSEKLIFAKMLVGVMTASIFISLSLSGIALGTDLEIRQGTYLFQTPLAQAVSAKTFIISPVSKQTPVKVGLSNKPTQRTHYPVVHFAHPISVHFQIDSAEIAPAERTKLLSLLQKFEVPKNAPLAVFGFTCKMGPTEFNVWLSNERATAVAELLEKEGYTVTRIEGKGSSNLVSKNSPPINRRVEITPFDTNSSHVGQPRISTKEKTP